MQTTKDMVYCFRCGGKLHTDGVCDPCSQEYQTSKKEFDFPTGFKK